MYNFFTPFYCKKVASLFLCGVGLVWFPDDDPLGIETYSNVLCGNVTQISKDRYCAFCWSGYCKVHYIFSESVRNLDFEERLHIILVLSVWSN